MHHSSTYVGLAEADAAFRQLIDHALGHDVPVEETGAGRATLGGANQVIDIVSDGNGLAIKVSAESESALYFLREAVVLHLAEVDSKSAQALRWDGIAAGAGASRLPSNFHAAKIAGRRAPIPGLIRLTLSFETWDDSLCGPGLHVKLLVPMTPGRLPVWPAAEANGATRWPSGEDELHVRYYTIKSADPVTRTVEIDIVCHEGGRVTGWAKAARPGDPVGLMGPAGRERPEAGQSVFLAGDQTALPALARTLETLAPGTRGTLLAAADGLETLQAYLPETGLDLVALPPARFAEDCLGQARHLVASSWPDFAWFAGEHQNAQAMRKLFKGEWGLTKGQQYAIAYWRDI